MAGTRNDIFSEGRKYPGRLKATRPAVVALCAHIHGIVKDIDRPGGIPIAVKFEACRRKCLIIAVTDVVDEIAHDIDGAAGRRRQRDPRPDMMDRIAPDAYVTAPSVGFDGVIRNLEQLISVDINIQRIDIQRIDIQ